MSRISRWYGHAIQLKRLRPNGKPMLLYQGSLTQCLLWWTSPRRSRAIKRDGRVWIEDLAEPARVIRNGLRVPVVCPGNWVHEKGSAP